MKKNNFIKLCGVSLIVSTVLASPVYAEEGNFRAPDEKTVNGVTYLDGIEVIPDNYAELKEKEFQKSADSIHDKSGGISTQGVGSWTKVSERTYYTGTDWDRYNNRTGATVPITLKTTSSMTASISGEMSYNFAAVAQASMTATIGQTYSKEFTQDVKVKGYHVTELKSAKKALEQNYRYTHDGWFGDKRYTASSLDHRGNEYWVYSNQIK